MLMKRAPNLRSRLFTEIELLEENVLTTSGYIQDFSDVHAPSVVIMRVGSNQKLKRF